MMMMMDEYDGLNKKGLCEGIALIIMEIIKDWLNSCELLTDLLTFCNKVEVISSVNK